MKLLIGLLSFLISVFASESVATAHEIHEASAVVTIRDQAVDVRINVDLLEWLQNITPRNIKQQDPADLMARLVIAERNMADTALTVDGKRLPIKIKSFPTVSDVVAALKAQEKGQHLRTVVALNAMLPRVGVNKLTLRLPEEVGSVVASLNRPISKFVQKGQSADFDISERKI